MNPIVQSLYERKSVRAYTNQPISPEIKQSILESAVQAPSAGNQILYTILDIQSQEKKDTLAILCDNQPFIAKAQMVLVFLADCKKWLEIYQGANTPARHPGPGDLMLAVSDAMAAAQNTVVAAESYGIGSCYIGDIMENKEKVTELLSLEPFLFPVAMLVFGYPTEQQKSREKPKRFALESVVMQDEYKTPSKEELVRMLEKRSLKEYEFEKEVSAFCKRKYMSEFAKEMNRSVEEYLKQFKDFN